MYDRSRAHVVSNNGITLGDGSWLTSGVGIPSHSGLAGDRYIDEDGNTYKLITDGSLWMVVKETDHHSGVSFIEADQIIEIESNRQAIVYGQLRNRGHLKIKGHLKMRKV